MFAHAKASETLATGATAASIGHVIDEPPPAILNADTTTQMNAATSATAASIRHAIDEPSPKVD
jgi:hypothetical protein